MSILTIHIYRLQSTIPPLLTNNDCYKRYLLDQFCGNFIWPILHYYSHCLSVSASIITSKEIYLETLDFIRGGEGIFNTFFSNVFCSQLILSILPHSEKYAY